MENQVRKCTKCSTVDQATVFRWGHQRRERQPEIPQVILPCRSPVNANYRTHISVFGFKKLEYRIKIVQNAALWTRLRFSGGAIKEERDDRKPSGDFTPSQPGRSRDYRTHSQNTFTVVKIGIRNYRYLHKYSDLPNNRAANLIIFWGKKHLHNLIRTYTFINF